MSELALVQFQTDESLKREVAEIYAAIGMDLPTALRMFMLRSKACKGLPFPANLPEDSITHTEAVNAFAFLRAQAADVPEMTIDEINSEIAAVRAERKS